MVRTLYHGSPNIIEKPIYGYGKTYNDYGLGFYCTDSLDMAKEWGAGKDRDGYANCYRLDCDGLRILHLNDPQFCILNLMAVVAQNREFDVPARLAREAKGDILQDSLVEYEAIDAINGSREDVS